MIEKLVGNDIANTILTKCLAKAGLPPDVVGRSIMVVDDDEVHIHKVMSCYMQVRHPDSPKKQISVNLISLHLEGTSTGIQWRRDSGWEWNYGSGIKYQTMRSKPIILP